MPSLDPFQTFAPHSSLDAGPAFPPLGRNVKALMVWPKFPSSFWGFEGVIEMVPEKSVMPPLGLITVAALCPAHWEIRLLDLTFDTLQDEDLEWADIVMVSSMQAQRASTLSVLSRARALGRRTFIGGPWASSEPEFLLTHADHVLVGECEEAFAGIAEALENGSAHALYRIIDKPDMTNSPLPRFDPAAHERVHVDARTVFPRLPVSMRILRHYHHLWSSPEGQIARTGHRGAG